MHVVEPQVQLVSYDSNAIDKLFLAAKRCTSDYEDIFIGKTIVKEVTQNTKVDLIRKCMSSGHMSILEHTSYTFHVICSRACSHQLVRHRLASYAQQSQRYVNYEDIGYIDKFFSGDKALMKAYVKVAETGYNYMLNNDIKPEEARYILPECTATFVIVTMNLREILTFLEQRMCFKAQDEIRFLANKIHSHLMKTIGDLLVDMPIIRCAKYGYCPESKPCGHKNELVKEVDILK